GAVGDPGQFGDPRYGLVADVPDRREYAAALQYPRDLPVRGFLIEPVVGLAGDHGIDGPVRYRDLLGAPGQRGDSRSGSRQPVAHGGIGLDRYHIVIESADDLCEDLGIGAELEYTLRWSSERPILHCRRV